MYIYMYIVYIYIIETKCYTSIRAELAVTRATGPWRPGRKTK